MHVDGLRVDAVASMLYLDYGRENGEWIPNQFGGKENLEAIEFIKHLNSVVHKRVPSALMIAEESTSFAGITRSVAEGGLGFDMKWNMGWMNDTLRYFQKDPIYRSHHQNELTFGLLYAFTERFASVFSHDEVVHGKKSLLEKMPGDMWQKFANLRLLYKREIDWQLTQYPLHKGMQEMVKELNHFSNAKRELWERDFEWSGFEWVSFNDNQNSVIAYLRKSATSSLLCVHNFTPTYHPHYWLNLSNQRFVELLFCSDDPKFGGSGKGGIKELSDEGIALSLPPLATMIFEVK
jgi:1,4-alpha-glucan branching enzyme